MGRRQGVEIVEDSEPEREETRRKKRAERREKRTALKTSARVLGSTDPMHKPSGRVLSLASSAESNIGVSSETNLLLLHYAFF
jgi:hypothetical protein